MLVFVSSNKSLLHFALLHLLLACLFSLTGVLQLLQAIISGLPQLHCTGIFVRISYSSPCLHQGQYAQFGKGRISSGISIRSLIQSILKTKPTEAR